MAICEGLEDWGATDLSNISDSEEEDQPAPLVRFCSCHCTGSTGEIICFYVKGSPPAVPERPLGSFGAHQDLLMYQSQTADSLLVGLWILLLIPAACRLWRDNLVKLHSIWFLFMFMLSIVLHFDLDTYIIYHLFLLLF